MISSMVGSKPSISFHKLSDFIIVIACENIYHPLSPMLFILAMDPLQRLLDLATQQGILTPLPITAAKWRTSLYADDAAIFISPVKDDVEAVKTILHAFGTFSGLHINLQKSSVHPIGCGNVDLDQVLSPLPVLEGASHANIWGYNSILDHCKGSMSNLS